MGAEVTNQANDKQQAVPLADAVLRNVESAGIELPKEDDAPDVKPKKIAATFDSGYFSEDNVSDMESLRQLWDALDCQRDLKCVFIQGS